MKLKYVFVNYWIPRVGITYCCIITLNPTYTQSINVFTTYKYFTLKFLICFVLLSNILPRITHTYYFLLRKQLFENLICFYITCDYRFYNTFFLFSYASLTLDLFVSRLNCLLYLCALPVGIP